jgi:hypothetical protein
LICTERASTLPTRRVKRHSTLIAPQTSTVKIDSSSFAEWCWAECLWQNMSVSMPLPPLPVTTLCRPNTVIHAGAAGFKCTTSMLSTMIANATLSSPCDGNARRRRVE